MTTAFMSAAVGFLVLISALGILYAILYRGVDAARISHDLQQPRREWRDYLRRGETVIKSVGESIPRPADELPRQALRLVQAGIRRKDGAVLFLGVQVLVALSLMLTVMVTGYPRINMLVAVLGSILVGVLIPDVWLKHTTEKRKERIRLALPDGIDLTVVCVEAGLGLDQALLRIAQELRIAHPDLSDELELMTLEVGAGRSRPEALRNLAKRTAVDDVSALAAMLIQTYRFGTSVGQSLRIYSENLRTKRRQRAEERAAKITVKMMIPMVLFIFPAILIVVGGPAMIQISEKLLPFLAGR